ncbi:MFS transporter [Planosporangium sp. 12N6]|uniref:MFS transporter n=1 Tax=Planosporangium spinosum TaxID=3402278 RepID=UPI003CF8D785
MARRSPISVLKIRAFRRLWLTLAMSSVGDWLGLLATGLFAASHVSGTAAHGAAFGGVVLAQLFPALLLGPLSGVLADRWDRRVTMITCDVLRFLLYASIPAAPAMLPSGSAVVWALVATFLAQACAMVWAPAKEAAVPNLVRTRLEEANQISLVTTYGVAPVFAALLLAALGRIFPNDLLNIRAPELALYFNACTFLAAAIVVVTIPGLEGPGGNTQSRERPSGVLQALRDGWRYAFSTQLLRGLMLGIVGAFAAGGVVIGAAPLYAESLSGGEASFGLLFATLFIGLGVGMALGPRLVGELSRRRWFGMSVVLAGAAVVALALAPHLAIAVAFAVLVGSGAGMAFLSGTTLLGTEVTDALRGRMFAFVQTGVRVVLMFATALGSLLSGIGGTHALTVADLSVDLSASRGVLLVAGLLAVFVGVSAFRLMDDKRGTPVLSDLLAAIVRRDTDRYPPGVVISLLGESDDRYAREVQSLLKANGHPCEVFDAEAAALSLGLKLPERSGDRPFIAPAAASLVRFAALAQGAERTVMPALQRGAAVVLCGLSYPVSHAAAPNRADGMEFVRLLRCAIGGRPAGVVLWVTRARVIERQRLGGLSSIMIAAKGSPEEVANTAVEAIWKLLPDPVQTPMVESR